MKTIRNKTHKPLRVPLPRGKTLHLGPKQEGQIADGTAEHPPFKKLLEAGEIEILGEGEQEVAHAPKDAAGQPATKGHGHSTTAFHTGER
jgi:hypothetical protein